MKRQCKTLEEVQDVQHSCAGNVIKNEPGLELFVLKGGVAHSLLVYSACAR